MNCGVDTRQLKRHWLNYPNEGFISILTVMSLVIINFEAINFSVIWKKTYTENLWQIAADSLRIEMFLFILFPFANLIDEKLFREY